LQSVRVVKATWNTRGKQETKKADVAEHPEVFHHVGLLINKPSGAIARLLFI